MRPGLRICTTSTIKAIRRSNCISRICIASFSHSARPLEESVRTQTEIGKSKKSTSERREGHGARKKRRRIAVPALALFGVAIPLGWYLKTRFEQNGSTTLADPREFVKYKLVGKDNVSSTCAIFRLKPSGDVALDLDNPELERAITSVEFKQPQLQIARSYTCLPQENGQPVDEIRFLIRREQKGEVSNFLHRLPVSSEVEVRGLHSEYILPNNVKSVVFLVGGTGIAPAMQAADAVEGQADVHILWASRRREDCIGGHNDRAASKSWWDWRSQTNTASTQAVQGILGAEKGTLVSMLENLKRRSASSDDQVSRLKVDYYVDEEGTQIRSQDVKDVLGSLSDSRGQDGLERNVLVVSGPPGFIARWAGAKQWAGGREVQGPLGGILSTLNLTGWEVVKL